MSALSHKKGREVLKKKTITEVGPSCFLLPEAYVSAAFIKAF